MNFLIFGGTKRAEVLNKRLSQNGYDTDYITSLEGYNQKKFYDYVILPIPTLTKDKRLNFGGEKKVFPSEFLKSLPGEPCIISCNYENSDFNIIDLNKREDFTYLNAIPTAEGAISVAISASEKSLSISKTAITGFGHVGKILAEKLSGLGSSVTIVARSDRDVYLAKALGYDTLHLSHFEERVFEFNFIFQTVPAEILNSRILDSVNKETIIIELSSGAKGIDMSYAKNLGLKVINAPALPEKTAPITAGNILYDCVKNIINE